MANTCNLSMSTFWAKDFQVHFPQTYVKSWSWSHMICWLIAGLGLELRERPYLKERNRWMNDMRLPNILLWPLHMQHKHMVCAHMHLCICYTPPCTHKCVRVCKSKTSLNATKLNIVFSELDGTVCRSLSTQVDPRAGGVTSDTYNPSIQEAEPEDCKIDASLG